MSAPVRTRVARLTAGEGSPVTAWALVAAVLLAAFVATAGPREITETGTVALTRTLSTLDSSETGVTGTGQWLALGPHHAANLMTRADLGAFSTELARLMRPPAAAPPALRWAGFATTLQGVADPAPSAVIALPPSMEVAYRTGLARHTRLVAGSRQPGRGGVPRGTVPVVLSRATAERFSVRPGSVILAGSRLRLLVTGIVVPSDPGQPFWTVDPLVSRPQTAGSEGTAHWTAGALADPGAATAVQGAVAGQFVQGTWFLPLDVSRITPATLPRLLSGLASMTTADVPSTVGPVTRTGPPPFRFQAPPAVDSSLAANLSVFRAEEQAASTVGSLIVAGVLAAALILLLICARLTADACDAELTLLRVRGGSLLQAAARLLRRGTLLAVPAAAAGGAAAVLMIHAPGTPLPWLPAAAAAVLGAGLPAALAGWRHRRVRLPASTGRDDLAAARGSARRTVAEVTVIVLAAGALGTLRLHGAQGHSGLYTSLSPVLAALAASLLVARLYPLPVRSLLRVAARRRGPVGFLGLAGVARARQSAALPALALVLTMTMAAFAAMVAGSVAAGQDAASWRRVGADAAVQAAGDNAVTARAGRALAAVPGVTRTAGVYTAPDSGPFAAQLTPASGVPRGVGLAVVDPAPYAALAGQTPWPRFPAGLLRRPARSGAASAAPVPVLVSRSVAARLGAAGGRTGGTGVLELDGATLTVRVAATIGATPAKPGGGSFVVLPQWAAGALPSIPGPDILLATGPAVAGARFRHTAAATVPGGQLTVRQRVISALRNAPAQAAAERVNTLGVWTAAALDALAILLGLAVTAGARSRLADRMSALGMAGRQARALALAETIPLLAVGVLGMAVAAVALAAAIGPALNLAVFATGAAGASVPGAVTVRPGALSLVLPAAGSIALALALVAAHTAIAGRHDTAAALRREEAG